MSREIRLDGGEISLLKTIGLLGTQVYGKILLDRIDEMEPAEFLDTLTGLIEQNYVVSNKVALHTIEDVERAAFSVNAAYAKDLRDALNPGRKREQERIKRERRR